MRKIFLLLTIISNVSIVFAQIDSLSSTQMDEIIITGQYKPQSLKSSVYQVRVINQKNIRSRNANNVQQILNTELGLRFSNDNTTGTSDVQLMGMGGRNVKILIDGVPMPDRGDTRESLNQIDVNTIDRIEIVDGPMSVSYGSDALSGVINIITKKSLKNNWNINVRVQEETAGKEYYPFTYSGLHQQSVQIGWKKNQWEINGGIAQIDFNGFGGDDYGRGKSWKPKNQWLGNVKIGFNNPNLSTYYRLDALDEDITGRGAINYNIFKTLDQRFFTHRYMHQWQSEWHVNNKAQLNTILSYTHYTRTTKTTEHNFETGSDELTISAGDQDTSTFNAITFRTTLQYALSDKVNLQPGIDINRETASGQRILGSPSITDYAFFISSEIKPTTTINIRPGLRFIKNSQYNAPPVIPSINTKIVLGKSLDLRMAYAYGFRAPALRELYFNFQDANHNIVGNPSLKAENSNSFTGALCWAKNNRKNIHFSFTLNGFYNSFKHLINYANTINNPAQFTLINIDKFKTTGFTWTNTIGLKDLKASIGFSYIGRYNVLSADAQYKNENLPAFVWGAEVNSNITYECKKIATLFSFFYKYTGKRPGYQSARINNEETVHLSHISDFSWADFTMSRDLYNYFTLSGGVKNIFNVGNITNTSSTGSIHENGGLVLPVGYGRSYFLSLLFHWNKK